MQLLRTWLLLAAVAALPKLYSMASPTPEPLARPPNIVVILADDLGYGDAGCYGGIGVSTPHIDRLAARGLRFTNAYAPSATCTPSRYAMLTGEYAWRQPPQQTSILNGDAPLAIHPGAFTLPAMLKRAGYATGLVGKWHLGLGDGRTPINFNGEITPGPLEVGFDSAFFIPATLDRVPCVYIENHRVPGLDPADPIKVDYQSRIGSEPVGTERPDLLRYRADRQHSDTIINGISRIGFMAGGTKARWNDETIADTLVERAEAFIASHRDRPFFLLFGACEPHVPRAPHPRFRGTSKSGIRGDSIAEFDWEVGRIVAALEQQGLTERTLVIITSDNGPILFDGYYDRSAEDLGEHKPAGGLRGWKYLRFEGGARIPFVATWPGHVPVGTADQLFSLVDLPATCASLTKKPMPSGNGRDSLNMLPVLLGEAKDPIRTQVVEHGVGNVLALRTPEWKYIPANADSSTGIGSGADPRDSRFADAIVKEPLLFDLTADPAEEHNVAAAHPDIVALLAAKLAEIRSAHQGERVDQPVSPRT